MCDKQCPMYGDCCIDSKFKNTNIQNNNFSCVLTKADGNVYMKTNCPQSWNQSITIKNNCESLNLSLLNVDVLLSTAVTNVQKGTTYRNLFCAICNGEIEFQFWNVGISLDIDDDEIKSADVIQQKMNETSDRPKPTLNEILSNFKLNSTNEWFLSSTVNNITCRIFMHATLSMSNLPKSVRYCIPEVIESCPPEWVDILVVNACLSYTSYTYTSDKVYKNPKCLFCNNESDQTVCKSLNSHTSMSLPFITTINDTRIPKINHCGEIPTGNSAYNILCKNATAVTSPATNVVTKCFAYTKSCLINKIFKIGQGLSFINNETIFLHEYDAEYPFSEFLNLTNESVYVCGYYLPKTTFQNVVNFLNDWISEILIKISIVCLTLHLLFFQQLPEMKNLSGKNLAAFCFVLLIALLCFEIGPRLSSCEVVAVLLHFSLISCFVWMLIMSYDCWLSLYRATKKFRSAGGKHKIKFLVYCGISLIVPIIIVGVSLYFEFAPPSVIPCENKPAYGKFGQCFIGQTKPVYIFFFIPATCMFLCNIAFFIHTALMIYFSQRNTVNPNTRKDFQLYIRLALMMGLTWILGSLTTVTGNVVIAILFSILNMSQGIFIFFYFTFKEKTIRSLMNKHKDNSFITNTLSTFVSSSSTAEAEPTTMQNILRSPR